jgi:putative thioredoxin
MTVATPGHGPATALDVTAADFERTVIARSREVLVVVDFWAPWCGPCRMLGPILERLASEAAGAWVLAKLDTDQNPSLAARFEIQGIPAVKAFRNGRVVAEFVGAQPESTVRAWLRPLLPSPADGLVAQAQALEAQGDLTRAEAVYTDALHIEPSHAAALLGLGRVQVAGDRFDAAVDTLSHVPRDRPERAEADSWLALARFRRDAGLSGGEVAARRRLAANPDDVTARLDLANALAAKGSYREALEGLLAVLQGNDGPARKQAQAAMLAIFDLLGDNDALTREYRPRLAAALW